ncbi:unnamed protein product [Durusdinium trenchii]|uniref:Uncharacterized protein n=2 Tax=Durusdinium trenchii TaxID=1381693 RepID=A0ABP0N1H3_9DINO
MDVSMSDRVSKDKAVLAKGESKWQSVQAEVRRALTRLKASRMVKSFQSVATVMALFKLASMEGESRQVELRKMRHALNRAKAIMEQELERKVEQRTTELRRILERKREDHLEAVLRTHEVHKFCGSPDFRGADRAVAEAVSTMLCNDAMASARFSEVLQGLFTLLWREVGIAAYQFRAPYMAWGVFAPYIPLPAMMFLACESILVGRVNQRVVGIDYIKARFHANWGHCIEGARSVAASELDCIKDTARRRVEKQEKLLREVQQSGAIMDTDSKKEFEELHARFGLLEETMEQKSLF